MNDPNSVNMCIIYNSLQINSLKSITKVSYYFQSEWICVVLLSCICSLIQWIAAQESFQFGIAL